MSAVGKSTAPARGPAVSAKNGNGGSPAPPGSDSRTGAHGDPGTPAATQTAASGSPAGTESSRGETIAILGGTGDLGTGLAGRWSRAGYRVVIGSRTLAKAQEALAALHARHPESAARAATNADAAEAADIVVLTVPSAHQVATLAGVRGSLAGKILIDVTVPLVPPRVGTVQLPA